LLTEPLLLIAGPFAFSIFHISLFHYFIDHFNTDKHFYCHPSDYLKTTAIIFSLVFTKFATRCLVSLSIYSQNERRAPP